jgi:hypothetical protein
MVLFWVMSNYLFTFYFYHFLWARWAKSWSISHSKCFNIVWWWRFLYFEYRKSLGHLTWIRLSVAYVVFCGILSRYCCIHSFNEQTISNLLHFWLSLRVLPFTAYCITILKKWPLEEFIFLWDAKLCSPVKVDHCSGGTYHFYLQYQGLSQAKNQHEAGSKQIPSNSSFIIH